MPEAPALVPDLDGELLHPLEVIEDALLALQRWEAEPDPPWLPAPLAHGVALSAVQRLHQSLKATQSRSAARGRLLGPGGRYEHAPLTLVLIDATDMATLTSAAQALGDPGASVDVVHAVAETAHAQDSDRTQLVAQFTRLVGLLDLAATKHTALLTQRLAMAEDGVDVVLTEAEEVAYQHTADRLNAMWSQDAHLDRFLY